MTGMLLNNTAYYFGINNELSYTFDFLINKFNALEIRVGGMEKGIDDIKTMLAKMLNNK